MRIVLPAATFPILLSLAASAPAASYDSREFLNPSFSPGEAVSSVFSRTISTRGPELTVAVGRISGTGTYRFVSQTDSGFNFDAAFLYDGRPVAVASARFAKGGREYCWDGKCSPATDGSGLVFNPLIWGEPPAKIALGTHWKAHIGVPWELGPAGDQEVTVTGIDPATGTITLLRKGSGDGPLDSEKPELKVARNGKEYLAQVTPGHAAWSGYTTLRKGIIVADELLVERSLTLRAEGLGAVAAEQRQFILLNMAPQASSWER